MRIIGPQEHVAGRRTLPWSWYSDPAITALEVERIFRCSGNTRAISANCRGRAVTSHRELAR
jgi:hypothetical protein